MLHEYPAHLDDTVFGHITGHLVPGTMLILLGFWWLYNIVYDIAISRSKRLGEVRSYMSAVWYGSRRANGRDCCSQMKNVSEPLIKISLGSIGCFMEVTAAHWTLFDEYGDFEHESMNNFSHATMFSFFTLSGVVDLLLHYGVLGGKHLSKTGHFIMSLAFFIEGFLFYFHLDGRSALDSHSHSIIYSVCFATSIAFVAESVWMDCGALGLLRCFLVVIQGTWFYQITFMLYGPRRWSKKSSAAAMLVPIAFAWHCLVMIAIFLLALIIGEKCFKGPKYCESDCDAVSMEHLLSNDGGDNERPKTDDHLSAIF